MHPSLPSQILNAFNSKVVCFFIISVSFLGITLADELVSPSSSSLPSFKARNNWSLKHSDPTRGGKFLNVPIYYGDWVPINSAKAQIESLASSVGTNLHKHRRKDPDVVTASVTDGLTSPVKSSFVVSDQHHHGIKQHEYHHQYTQDNDADERVETVPQGQHFTLPTFGPRLPNHHSPHKDANIRHNSVSRPYNRLRAHYRGGGGISGNSRRKYRPTNSDALTRLFGPSLGSALRGSRRQHRKITQPHHSQNSIPLVGQISSIFGASPTQDTLPPQTTTSTGSIALETLGNVFNIFSPSSPGIKGTSRPENHYLNQHTSESIYQPIIKLLPSPDLAQNGVTENNLIYEDDGNGKGDIIVGRRPGQNEITGFVPVTSGQTIRQEYDNTEHDRHNPSSQHAKRPSNFSVLISGISKTIDVQTLAKLFKEGKIAEKGNHKAFIGSPDAFAPDGFHKITLPFMDPSHSLSDVSELPSIFIAPLGYKAPKGYKGHPLPFDPASSDPHYSSANKGKINLIHTTEPSLSIKVDESVEYENEVKTAIVKNPFLRDKLRNQRLPFRPIKATSTTEKLEPFVLINEGPDTTEKAEESVAQNGKQNPSNFARSKIKFTRNRYKPSRKRVLTKIVRKPYTPSITTPSPTLETKKIVRIIDPTSISLKVEEYFPPTSGRPILGDRNKEKIDVVNVQDYNVTASLPSLGISTTFRPIQIKYLDLQPSKKANTLDEPESVNIVTDAPDYKSNSYFYDEDNVGVTHFEPTTTHNNVIFETTKSDEETTTSIEEKDNHELTDTDDDDELTTVPTSFVTRSSFTTPVTNRPTTKLIQFVPYSPAATTRTTTSRTTTTSKVVTDPNNSYEPTPFNFHLDPIARLERLNQLKNKKYGKNRPSILDREQETEYIIPTVRPATNKLSEKISYKVHNNRIKYRKYGYNQGKDDGRIFGQRIKQRKRPNLWDNGYVRENRYSTTTEEIETTTGKKTKTDELKNKFRPFFDQLYEQLANENDKDVEEPEGNNRRISVFGVRRKLRPYKGWRKKSRSTTTPNPFTINAEIYEVHPESRARITTTTSTPLPTIEVVTESSTQYEDYSNELEDADYKANLLEKVDKVSNSYETTESITDVQDHYKYKNDVHETADKHSQVHHNYGFENTNFGVHDSKSSSILIPFQDQTQFRPSVQDTNELFHNGLVNSDVALEFGESQFVENTLNEVTDSSPEASAPPATRLLDEYQKTFQPSSEIASEHDSSYKKPNGIINEHSQQKLTVKEGDFIPFHNEREGDNWEPRPLVPYVEIQRVTSEEKAPLSISVETVPTDDTSLIQEVLEEVYNISVPLDGGLEQQKDISSQNEVYHKPLPDYSSDYRENEAHEEPESAKADITTAKETLITTTLKALIETESEDITTVKHNIETQNTQDEETTISFFVTPTTQKTNTYNDETLSDPGPTIQESSLIIENADVEEITTTSGTTLKEDSSPESIPIDDHIKLTEVAVPEVVDSTSDDEYNNDNTDRDTTTISTTASPTTVVDNFEVTTFRPRRNGGFFDNFNLASLLSYIVPKTTTTPVPITTIITTKTTEEESRPATDITTTRFSDEKSETVTETNVGYTTQTVLKKDFTPTSLPSTVSSSTIEEQTTLTQSEEKKDFTDSLGSTSTSLYHTKTLPTEAITVQDETTYRYKAHVPQSTFDTTTEEEEIDTTTTGDIVFTSTELKVDETTEYNDDYDDSKTTVPNYTATTQYSRVRTERPFRGPLRLQKKFKKGIKRYQQKNKKLHPVLLQKKDEKAKKDNTISKAVYGAIKREEYIKNWVARKYNKLENNSKKRLFSLNTTYQPQTTIVPSQETTADGTTFESQTSVAPTIITSTNKNAALPFAPTVLPPKNKFFNVDLDVTVRDGSSTSSVSKTSSLNSVSLVKNVISEKRKTFLDKLKSTARKNLSDNLFAKNVKNGKSSETSSSNISLPTHKSSKKISWAYPRGSNTNVFKKWGGDSLSQAEFERTILGVSTATEVSVKSMICVRGRCYNADDKSLAKN